jgi:hypothetical protein
MENTELQKKLWLWLAVKTANQTIWNQDYSYRYDTPWQKEQGIAFSMSVPEEQKIDLWGWSSNLSSRWISPVTSSSVNSFSSISSPTASNVASWSEKMWDIAWITPKKKKNIAETLPQTSDITWKSTIPVNPITPTQDFWQATKWQDVQFRQSYRQALETPKISPTTTSPTGLSGAELQAYNMLTPQEQKTYQALATQGMKAQTDYLAKSKASMEFQQSQEKKRLEMEDNQDAIADMNSQKNIEEATRQVANLKQNIGYLWTWGQPWVSAQKLDAVSNQVTLADKTLQNIIEAERLAWRNREIGQEKNSEIFTRQIKILQDDLDSKVNKTIQSALNNFTSAELEGKLDTIPEIEAFQQQLYAQLDGDLSSIMDTNIEARKFLIERYDKLAESQKKAMADKEKADAEALKRKNTLNKEMSQALGYYVNDNGEALVDRVTWQNIVVPPDADVTFDKDSGQMVILTKNRDGTVGVELRKVTSWKVSNPVIQEINGQKMQYNPETNTWSVPNIESNISPTQVTPQIISQLSPRLKWNNVQCGMVTNDYNAKYFPNAPRMGDTIESKIATVNSIGTSTTPQVWGNFVMDIWTDTGHTGIVQSVNLANWTFTATDANRNGSKDWWPIETNTYRISDKVIFSKAPSTQISGTQWDQTAEAMALVQWLWGTEWERATYAKNIIDRANKKWLSLIEAKKELGYKTLDDKNFEETRKQQYTEVRKSYSESTWNAKTALTLLNEPQTAIWDVASVVWFLKTIDPASVARESEVQSVENARGIIDSLSNVFQKAKEGTKLTDTQREQLKSAIQTIVTAQDNKFYETVYDMKKDFNDRWLDPSVYIPKTYIDKADKMYWKAETAKKKLGGTTLTDILSLLKPQQ